MSIEQVRKVLDKYAQPTFLHDSTRQRCAAEIHALYASERGGDAKLLDLGREIADTLNRALNQRTDSPTGNAIATAIITYVNRAIDARVGAKAAREGGVHAPIVAALDTVCEGWDNRRFASDKPHTDADMAAEAIRALAEAKATAERELQLAKNKLCAIGNTLASKPSDYEGRAVDGVTLKGASGNVLFNSDAQVAA